MYDRHGVTLASQAAAHEAVVAPLAITVVRPLQSRPFPTTTNAEVGVAVGALVGTGDGDEVGLPVGLVVGLVVGPFVGLRVGGLVGHTICALRYVTAPTMFSVGSQHWKRVWKHSISVAVIWKL